MLVRRARVLLPLTAMILAVVASSPRATAGGFQLRDQSGSGQGNAYAGIAAGGSDISSMFFNPAAMIRYSGNHLQIGLTEIMPSAKLSGAEATRTSSVNAPIDGGTSTGNVASSALIPTVYAMWSVDDDLKLGFSVNVPFGLSTDYGNGWAGRYQGLKSYLQAVDFAPSIAWRTSPNWTLGAAFVARRAKAHLSQALDLGYQTAASLSTLTDASGDTVDTLGLVGPGSADGTADVRGSGWGYGYRLGLLFEPTPKLHIGLGYQSRIRETIKGSVSFNTPASLGTDLYAIATAPSNAWANPGLANLVQSLGATTANGSASAVIHFPATFSLGVDYQLTPTLSLAAELDRTIWSSFHELRVHFGNQAVQPDDVTEEHWKDSTFISLGATWRRDARWTYRAGLARDTSPVPDANRTPRIPDADRTWISVGASYQFTKHFGMDAGYTHAFVKDAKLDLQGGSNARSSEFYRGNLTGTYKNSIDILAVQARYKF